MAEIEEIGDYKVCVAYNEAHDPPAGTFVWLILKLAMIFGKKGIIVFARGIAPSYSVAGSDATRTLEEKPWEGTPIGVTDIGEAPDDMSEIVLDPAKQKLALFNMPKPRRRRKPKSPPRAQLAG